MIPLPGANKNQEKNCVSEMILCGACHLDHRDLRAH